MKLKKLHLLFFFTIGVLLLGVQHQLQTFNEKPIITLSKQQSATLLNDDMLIYFNLGQKRLLSSLVWIETLMESDLEHYKSNDLNSWMFLRFSTLSKIDPYFYEVYRYGGLYLSIVKDDAIGADELYQRGLKLFPNDSALNLNYAFNSYFELGNIENGIKGYETALKFDPKLENSYVPSLIQRLKAEKDQGVNEDIFNALYERYRQLTPTEREYSKLKQSLYAVRAELDLNCLNNNKEGCNKVDFLGEAYEKYGDKYFSRYNFSPFRIKKRRGKTPPITN